jgi:tRNA A-37 threonylcarbamoyl transferase component Bud32
MTWIKNRQIGKEGKEGKVFAVSKPNGKKEYAMKVFKKTKSSKNIEKEVKFAKIANKAGLSPKIFEVNLTDKYIVMDMCDKTILDLMKEQKYTLKVSQQKELIKLFSGMDKVGIMHNDPNPLNILVVGDQFKLIDFGMSKSCDIEKCNNKRLLTLGFLLFMKQQKYPIEKLSYLVNTLSKEDIDLLYE